MPLKLPERGFGNMLLQFHFIMKTFEKLNRDEMKNVFGGVAAPPEYDYQCTAQTSCCGTISYFTTDQDLAQAWFNVYAAAQDSPQCTAVQTIMG